MSGDNDDTEQDSPNWMTDLIRELKDRDFERVNDPRNDLPQERQAMNVQEKINNEPVLTGAALTPIAVAVVAAIGQFVTITPEQQAAIVSLIVLVVPFIGAWLARRKVTPVANPKDNDGTTLVRGDL